MWNYLYDWAKDEKQMKKNELKLLKKQTDLFRTLSSQKPKLLELFRLMSGNVKVLLNPDFRKQILDLFR